MNRIEAIRIADDYYHAGEKEFNNHEYVRAVQYADSAMELYSYFEDSYRICKTLNLKGKILGGKGNETASLEKYLEGIELAKEKQYDDMLCIFYNNIAYRYEYIEQYTKAMDYYKESYRYFKKLDVSHDKKYQTIGMKLNMNFFDMYSKNKNIEKMEVHLEKFIYYLNKENDENVKKNYEEALILRESFLALYKGQMDIVKSKIGPLLEMTEKHYQDHLVWSEYQTLIRFMLEAEFYKEAEMIIVRYEEEANRIEDLESALNALKYKIKLFKAQNRENDYQMSCVKYYEYSKDKDVLNRREKGYALDFKIAIRKIDAARKKAENLLEIDSLTLIKNRYSLYKEGHELFAQASSNSDRLVLGILDIDEFKDINARIGHVGGDTALKTVASIISKVIKEYGTVYRLGGDEFVILFRDVETYEVERIARHIRDELKRIPIFISQGYVRFCPKENEEVDQVINRADKLLYNVKDLGKDDFRIIDEDC